MEPQTRSDRLRNLTGFWILGLCNNFGYVVMLSAAHDILTEESPTTNNQTEPAVPSNRSGKLVPRCNSISTGAVLLADVLPTLIIKLLAPFCIHHVPYWLRVAVTVFFGLSSMPIVALSHAVWVSLFGVVCASISSGLGEITFLSLSTFFDKNVVSTWSSGTGAAGVFGALSYAGLLAIGLSSRNSLFLMMVVPASLGLTYYLLLVQPVKVNVPVTNNVPEPEPPTDDPEPEVDDTSPLLRQPTRRKDGTLEKFKYNLNVLVTLLPYMIPLSLVYLAEYFINQGLQELIYFENIWLPVVQQYRWYQVIYQVGVLISRSSVNCFRIRKLWILPVLQILNVALLLFQIFFKFVPSIWIVFFIILYEGLLGGSAYVNTFYTINEEVKEEDREFSMGVACVGDSLGVSIAGAVSIPVHDVICTL